jgi:hypothetical protein
MNMNTQYRKLYRGLMLAGVTALPFALAGCFPSSSSDRVTQPDDVDVTGSVAFMDTWMDGAPDVQWGPETVVTAFAPAQRSWEWVTTDTGDGSHPAFARGAVNGGAACTDCHGVSAPGPAALGASLVGADEDPIPGKRGSVDIALQAAYDAEKFYLKASWQTLRPGATHDIWTYMDVDGTLTWVRNSHEKPEELDEGEVYSREDRIAVMFSPVSNVIPAAPGHDNEFNNVGCWVTCHVDMHDMPDMDLENYTLGDEITKYLKISRVGGGGANDDVDVTAVDAAMAAGTFPDMWHFRGARSAALQTLTDGFVMSTRASDSGSNPYISANNNPAGGTGYMYDAAWMAEFLAEAFPDYQGETEVNAFPGELWGEGGADGVPLLENAPPLIIGVNTAEFDAGGAFPEGGILPRRILDAGFDRENSRNDVQAYSSWQDGVWTVIMVRDLDTGNAQDHVLDLQVDYTFAFSIFEDHSGGRWHHVTFPVTLGTIGSGADIEAQNQ